MVKVCGPKSSLCCLIISAWGIVQLVFMGIFYFVRSVALVEDLSLPEEYPGLEEFYIKADAAYTQNAYNCWIAACLYIFTLVVSGHQFYVNNRSSI